MDNLLIGTVVVPGATAFMLLVVFTYLHRQNRAAYFRAWQLAWAFYVVHFLLVWIARSVAPDAILLGLAKSALVATALSIYISTRLPAAEFRLQTSDVVLAFLGVAWAVLDAQSGGSSTMLQAGGFAVPRVGVEVGVAALLIAAGARLYPLARERDSMAFRLLSLTLGFWAVLFVTRQLAGVADVAGQSNMDLFLGPLPQIVAAIAMVMAMYEDERRTVQDNLLAFSSLNVDTDRTLESGELASAMDELLVRLMSLLAVERAVIAMAPHWQRTLPSVARGFADEMANRLERRGAGEAFRGVLAGRALRTFASPQDVLAAGLPEEEVEQLSVVVEELRRAKVEEFTVAALRTHEQNFGILLLPHAGAEGLGAPRSRLLAGLVTQMGLTLENYVLIHDAHRRARELELLTHIGKVVSSRLDPDEVLLAVQRELGHVFDTRTFVVAFQFGEQVRFELEVVEGEVLPKRTRPAAKDLVEHIIRTGQPLLVRQQMEQVQKELNLERTGRPAKSFCGVPIVMYERPVGMMAAMHHAQEFVYEQRDLDVMSTAAGQVAVAIENARMFAEEQRRARYLAFLNNISKTAISSQNAEEMLAEIVSEIQKNFLYDHIGIGILDYASKDIEIKAEAGSTAKALGRRVPLGVGILGRVARTNEMALVQNTREGHLLGILPESKSVLCIPLTYSETLLGVLNVESQRENAFAEQDVLILRTLADLLATALHNAFVFQKMQHQSITDGLTGIKTRRYFLEALQSEWKRASRSGRPFSVVLLDLDKFKEVNDTMGHLEGDLVLARVGRLLEQKCRQSNVVSRYGGDEFMILMPETGVEQAQILSERLRLWIATDPMLNERKVTGSFGVSTFPLHGATVEDVVRIADAGMYLSKQAGGNRVSTAEDMAEGESREYRQLVNRYIEGFLRRESTGPDSAGDLVNTLQSLAAEAGEADRAEVLMNAIRALTRANESREAMASGHGEAVARHAETIGKELMLAPEDLTDLIYAARVHDVGKIVIPEEILNKPEVLNEEEYRLVKMHAAIGGQLVETIPGSDRIRLCVRHHHERFDGKGYPDGLTGEQTPLGARIIAVADAFVNMTTERPHAAVKTPSDAMRELEAHSGTQFDGMLVRIFVHQLKDEGVTRRGN